VRDRRWRIAGASRSGVVGKSAPTYEMDGKERDEPIQEVAGTTFVNPSLLSEGWRAWRIHGRRPS